MRRNLLTLLLGGRAVTRIFFDTNVFSHLVEDRFLRNRVSAACKSGLIEVIVTPVLEEELQAGPLGGVPEWLPVRFEGEGIAVAGGRVGDHLSDGKLMQAHLGASRKANDAILAESAELADIFVSEDRRFSRRLRRFGAACEVMGLADFDKWLAEQRAYPDA